VGGFIATDDEKSEEDLEPSMTSDRKIIERSSPWVHLELAQVHDPSTIPRLQLHKPIPRRGRPSAVCHIWPQDGKQAGQGWLNGSREAIAISTEEEYLAQPYSRMLLTLWHRPTRHLQQGTLAFVNERWRGKHVASW
jgi:hypothetical protein